MQIIIKNRSELLSICNKYKVAQLYVFGSHARGISGESSDVDFLVFFREDIPLIEYADNFFDLIISLEKLLNKKIDVVSGKAIKNQYFLNEINKTKVLVYDHSNNKIAV